MRPPEKHQWGLAGTLIVPCLIVAAVALSEGASALPDAPRVRLVSPVGGYVMEPLEGKKVLIYVEIVDVSGAGIKVSRSGIPQFVHPNRNVSLFLDRVIAKSTYTSKHGEEVIQLAALVPIEKLETSEEVITPPIHFKRLRPSEGEREFTIPLEDMVHLASFNFQVKDLNDTTSEPVELAIGFASRVWVPAE